MNLFNKIINMNSNHKASLGLHFGHDGSITMLNENKIFYHSTERHFKIKHAIGVDINKTLQLINENNIQKVYITSTQGLPVFIDSRKIKISIDSSIDYPAQEYFCSLPKNAEWKNFFYNTIKKYSGKFVYEESFNIDKRYKEQIFNDFKTLSNQTIEINDKNSNSMISHEGFIEFEKKKINLIYLQHHFLHAMYSVGAVGKFKKSFIISVDGGSGDNWWSGGIYYFDPKVGLKPISPIDGWVGNFYDYISFKIGLFPGGAGKMMGLAPYGKPIYFSEDLVGTKKKITKNYKLNLSQVYDAWLDQIGYDCEYNWDTNTKFPPKIVADIASSAQLIFEKNILKLFEAGEILLKKNKLEYENILFTGGCALNCPINTILYDKYKNFFVPPAVNDEGLSIGAAIFGWKDQNGSWPKLDLSNPYNGYELKQSKIDEIAIKKKYQIIKKDHIKHCIEKILQNEVVAVIDGRSETGPRALGHRSLVANAFDYNVWEKVNKIKNREKWRPFAPIVLEEDLENFFDFGPKISRYMLFNYRVITKKIPAVTHFDHSARVQTVKDNPETFKILLNYLKKINHPPILLNTSLNGRNVPIAEDEKDIFNTVEEIGVNYIFTKSSLYFKK